jgi:hypothetical protein
LHHGDVQRPTTTARRRAPSNVDPSFLLADDHPENCLRLPLLENMIWSVPRSRLAQASELRCDEPAEIAPSHVKSCRVLPHCDVLVCVGTAQVQNASGHANSQHACRQIVSCDAATTDADIRPLAAAS